MRRVNGWANGLRSGPWSENKLTNQAEYSPYDTEIYRITKESERLLDKEEGILYRTYKPHPESFHPTNQEQIQKIINNIPSHYLTGLKGIFLCSGSKKQLNCNEFRFASYNDFYKVIYLFPFPKTMCLHYKTKPKPSICIEYERHGTRWIEENNGWVLKFDKKSIQSFYLKDVLFHELGHHVENQFHDIKHKSDKQRERFAEWFAIEYGLKSQIK